MTAHTELTWWSTDQLDGLAGQIDGIVNLWRRDWRSSGARVAPTARNVLNAGDVATASWLRHGAAEEPSIWLDETTLTVDAVCADLFGPSRSTPVMQAVGASARLDLIERLCLRMSVGPTPQEGAMPVVGPWMGYVDLTIPFVQRPARFLLNAPSVFEFVQRRHVARAVSAPRAVEEAVQSQGVSLEVRLSDVELDVADLQSLQAGDLIVLDHSLAQPLSIHSRDSREPLPCDAYLGKIGECKAVQLHVQTSPGEDDGRYGQVH